MHKQSGFTLIELMIVIAIISILAAIATVSYQTQVKQSQLTSIYHELNQFRLPYQILIDQGAGVTDYSPTEMNLLTQTNYCQFNITAPDTGAKTEDAVTCQIQNLNYVQGEKLSLDRNADGTWQCRASLGISKAYLPQPCQ
ncbi:prepilin-type N-terminal cleavage/methylation domain-containing protein [Psychrobacter okhotskensis]|uniref:prepilin-type N-terminal cleavage/methylation domain-containing protein n=1 Tax=Psychrobacter okhotskensis TaxID=212403 RepID=UPI001918F506|nr:prepilin-type N-terminal cleavage/methylation domain-containing protein [Psychrobacter okhotskensis]